MHGQSCLWAGSSWPDNETSHTNTQRERQTTTYHVSPESKFPQTQAYLWLSYCCPVTQSRLTLRPHELQHTRLCCPSLSPWVCSNSCPLSQWCYLTISSSVTLFSFCLQSFPASGSFSMSRLFASGGQSTGASSVLPTNVQDWFPLGWTGLISLLSKGFSRVFSSNTVQKHQFFSSQPSLWSIRDYWENHNLIKWIFVGKVMPLLFNVLEF